MNTNPMKKETNVKKKNNRSNMNVKVRVEPEDKSGYINCQFIGMNRAINIVSEACSSCWNTKLPTDFDGRAEYIAKRSRTGHTSILEHSNFVVYLNIPKHYSEDFINFLSWNRFLNVYNVVIGDTYRVLVGGSFRGYSDLFMTCNDLNNPVLKAIENELYMYAHSAVFEDICKLGLMDINNFSNCNPDNFDVNVYLTDEGGCWENDRIKIVHMDSLDILVSNIKKVDPEFASSIPTFNLIKFITISVLFKNMSRIITQQLTRHRNAITQESQRYVDYSDIGFNSPHLFKSKYDKDYKYSFKFGNNKLSMTSQEIGDAICGIYKYLAEDKNFPMNREDARGFLPLNGQCGKLYMTFRFDNLFKFLQLREASGAQAEIKLYAIDLGNVIRDRTRFNSKELTDSFTNANILINDPFEYTNEVTESEDVIPITEEDYINYMNKVEEEK